MTTKKKWAIGVGVFLALGLLGAILDDEKSSTSGENKAGSQQSEQTEQKQETKAEPQQSEQTEQKQETEAERKAREQKEKAERKEAKKKEIAERGYKDGYELGFGLDYHQYETFNFSKMARRNYTAWYGAPSSSEEKELYDIFEQNYKRGIEEGYKAQN